MERKPWPIIVLAVLHFLEPITKIAFYITLWRMPLGRYLSFLIHHTTTAELLLFMASFPIGGVCILAVKKWSLPAYVAMQVVTFGGHMYHHVHSPHAFPLWLVGTFTLFNLAVVAYFLLPAVRLAYLDPKLRWWEAKPRFLVNWKAKALQGKLKIDVTISNLSEGGVFLMVPKSTVTLDVALPVQVEFDLLKTPFSLVGEIRHYSAVGEAKYGIQFSEMTPGTLQQLRKGMKELRRQRYPRQGPRDTDWTSFKNWARTLLTTGKGLFPEPKPLPVQKTQLTVENTNIKKQA